MAQRQFRSAGVAERPVEVGRLFGDVDGLLVLAEIDERGAEQQERLSFTRGVSDLPAGGEVVPASTAAYAPEMAQPA